MQDDPANDGGTRSATRPRKNGIPSPTLSEAETCHGHRHGTLQRVSHGHTGLGTYRDPETRPARPVQLPSSRQSKEAARELLENRMPAS